MTSDERTCFVLMPFAQKYKEIYESIYKPVCRQNNIKCWRVDEIKRPGSITADIINGIIESDVIIADLTSKNPNVFYELGIAHSQGNKTIMTSQSIEDVPFDIANYRVILYEQSISGAKLLSEVLDLAIKELLKSLNTTNNPVQSALSSTRRTNIMLEKPLVEAVDVVTLTREVRKLIEEHHIYYIIDFSKIDLEHLANKTGFGYESLRQIAYLFKEYKLYDNLSEFQEFIVKNRIYFFKQYEGKKWQPFIDSVEKGRQG